MDSKHTEQLQHYSERVGLLFETAGMPRMAGRILGWLLICDPPQQTALQLAEALDASKGSISAMTRLLINAGMIERVSLPGERRDYFHIRDDAWYETVRSRLTVVTVFRELAEEGLEIIADAPDRIRRRLEDMRELYAFFEAKLPEMFEQWTAERQEKQP